MHCACVQYTVYNCTVSVYTVYKSTVSVYTVYCCTMYTVYNCTVSVYALQAPKRTFTNIPLILFTEELAFRKLPYVYISTKYSANIKTTL